MSPKLFSPLPLLWLLSFFCALYWFQDYQLEMFAGCVIACFAWSFGMLSRGLKSGWRLEKSPVLILGAAFWALVVASVFWSDIKPISLMGLCFFSVMPLTFFSGVMAGTDSDFKKTGYFLAVLFAGLSVWAMFQFFFLNSYFMGQARHPLSDPSSLGALFSLALFCTLGWILSDRPQGERRMAVVLASLLVCGIMATVARGPVFAFIPGIVLLAVLLWPQIKVRKKSLMVIVLTGAAFYGLMQTGVQKRYDLGERIFGTVILQGDVTNNRIDLWKSTIEMIKDHPWTGTGIGTFYLYYPQHRLASDENGAYLAHNDPLQFWVELGVLGPLLFYAFAIAAAWRSFAALKKLKCEESRHDRIIVASSFAGLTAMVVQSHVSFNHYNLTILMISGLMMAVWFIVTGRALNRETIVSVAPDNTPTLANRFALALPFLMVGWLFVSLIAGEYFTNRARNDLFTENMFSFADNINNAGRVSQGMNYRAYLLAVNVPMSILEVDGPKLKEKEGAQKKLYDQVTGYMQDVLAINPVDSSAYFYLGKVQTLVEKDVVPEGTPSPEEYYKNTLQFDPLHLGARLALFRLYQEQKKTPEELLAFMEPALEFTYVTPMAMEYYGEVTKLYLENKNMPKAQEMMQRMANFSKRDSYSRKRQATTIPQAIMGDDALLQKP